MNKDSFFHPSWSYRIVKLCCHNTAISIVNAYKNLSNMIILSHSQQNSAHILIRK